MHVNNTEGNSFKTLWFFQVIRLCSHRFTFMLMTWKISSIFSTVTARIIARCSYLFRILLTHPCETCSRRLISHGRTPCSAIWRMSTRRLFGRGRPFVNKRPYWLIALLPVFEIQNIIFWHILTPKFVSYNLHRQWKSLLKLCVLLCYCVSMKIFFSANIYIVYVIQILAFKLNKLISYLHLPSTIYWLRLTNNMSLYEEEDKRFRVVITS